MLKLKSDKYRCSPTFYRAAVGLQESSVMWEVLSRPHLQLGLQGLCDQNPNVTRGQPVLNYLSENHFSNSEEVQEFQFAESFKTS